MTIIMKMGHQCKMGARGGISRREEGEKREHWEMKRVKVYYMYMYEGSIMKQQTLFQKSERRRRGTGNTMEG
jgi:hypothetical protein